MGKPTCRTTARFSPYEKGILTRIVSSGQATSINDAIRLTVRTYELRIPVDEANT